MIVARFGPSTDWVGKTITYDDGTFTLEGHGPIRATDMMAYDAESHLVWDSDGTRAWVGSRAAAESAKAANPVPPARDEVNAVCLGHAKYIGGSVSLEGLWEGKLWVTVDWIGLETGRRQPLRTAIAVASVESVSVDGGQVAKSKVLPVLAFGVFGLAAKSTEDRAYLVVTTKEGELPTYEIYSKSPVQVRAMVAPVLKEAGIALS